MAGEPHAAAVGREADFLVKFGAVEHGRVGAALALDDVAGVARVPDKRVVASAELRRIVAAPADDEVIAIAADERVVAVAAGDLVVAGAAVDRELDEAGEAVPGSDGVVAAIGVEDEIFGCADIKEERRQVEPCA